MSILLKDKFYVPESLLRLRDVKKHFERHIYKEAMCRKCSNRPLRFNSVCAACPGHLKFASVWGKVQTRKGVFWTIPRGDPEFLRKTFPDVDWDAARDGRSAVRMRHRWRFTAKLFREGDTHHGHPTADQVRLVHDWLRVKRGFLVVNPGAGKTTLAIYIAIRLGLRVLFLADKDKLLKQCLAELYEKTNLSELEARHGKTVAGIVEKDADFDRYTDFVLCTYQKFIRPDSGRQRLIDHVRGKFGLVEVDEADMASAECFARVVNSIDARFRAGFTATYERKDGLHDLVQRHIIGRVVSKGENRALSPEVKIISTGLAPEKEIPNYTYAMQWLAYNPERNKILVRLVFEILRSDPRRTILIPVTERQHVELLVGLINRQAMVNNQKRGETWNTTRLAMPFYRGVDQKQTFKYVEKAVGTRVLVAIRSMAVRGVNVLKWTDLIYAFLLSNPPQCLQLTQRICRPAPDKPRPQIWTVVDDTGLSHGCARTSYLKTFVPEKYTMDRETRETFHEICKSKRGAVKHVGSGNASGSGNKSSQVVGWNDSHDATAAAADPEQ